MNKQERNEKGFTMVELIIVVAIMGIIGALLVPAFSTMSAKARLTTDISTVKTLKRTADVYKAEQGAFPNATNLADMNSILINSNYLNANAVLQTKGDIVVNSASETIKLSLTNTAKTGEYSGAIHQLDTSTQADWIN